mgnify:CR=1 FL=1
MLDLPERFDEYEETRREGFLRVKELKEKGANIVGFFVHIHPMN